MKNLSKNKGFLQYVIIAIVAICLLAYFDITLKEAVGWFMAAVKKVF